MFQGEHSAILSTFIKLPFVIKIFVLSIIEWPFYTGFTVFNSNMYSIPPPECQAYGPISGMAFLACLGSRLLAMLIR